VGSRLHPRAEKDGLARAGERADHVRLTRCGLRIQRDLHRETIPPRLDHLARLGGIATPDQDTLEGANQRQGLKVRMHLPTGSHQQQDFRILPRQRVGGDGRGGSGADMRDLLGIGHADGAPFLRLEQGDDCRAPRRR